MAYRSCLWRLLFAQTQVAFNDNAAKMLLMALAAAVLPNEEQKQLATTLMAALLVVPTILLSPFAGWLADRYSKSHVLNWSLIGQIIAMGWLLAAVWTHHLDWAIAGFGLLAVQVAIFSPAKMGILKEIVGSERLIRAVGWMEMLTITAILLGGFAGGWLFDVLTHHANKQAWVGALWGMLILSAGALLAWWVFIQVRFTEARAPQEKFRASLFWEHFEQLRRLWSRRDFRLAALGVAYFFALGNLLFLILWQECREYHSENVTGAGTMIGVLLCCLGSGLVIGCLWAGYICRKMLELGLVAVGAVGVVGGLVAVSLATIDSLSIHLALIAVGLFGAFIIVPLNTYLQDRAGEEERGRIMAASNLLTSLIGVATIALQYFMAITLKWDGTTQVMALVPISVGVAYYVVGLLPEGVLRLIAIMLGKIFYRIEVFGLERIPSNGALLICNHVSYVDAIILGLAIRKRIRFIAFEWFHKQPILGLLLRIFGVLSISPQHSKEAIRTATDALRRGELVAIFPEGQLTRIGLLLRLERGFELIARRSGKPVIPVTIDSLWGSIFSFKGGRYFWKWPHRLPYHVRVHIGEPLAAQQATAEEARWAMMDGDQAAFSKRPELNGHLAWRCFKGLIKHSLLEIIIDRTNPEQVRRLKAGTFLALAIALSKRWKKLLKGENRVGVVLPPGIGGHATNLALQFLNIVPVNLNYTMGKTAATSCIRRSGIRTIITAEALKKRFPEFPWNDENLYRCLDISEEIKACGKKQVLKWLVLAHLFRSTLGYLLGIPRHGGQKEAGLLFTSGSVGEPKGVPLTHRNIIANIEQIAHVNVIQKTDKVLACLPIFHSFGFTVTLWYPLACGVPIVTLPSPLDTKAIAEAVKEEKITLLISTPTFLRGHLKRTPHESFKSLRAVITGAEKLPSDLARAFENKFNIKIYEGYGLTETSPVVSVNLPDPPKNIDADQPQEGSRKGSVGRLLPGITARIVDSDTGKFLGFDQTGILWLKGANVFNGYFQDPERTETVFHDGWFITGDIARLDKDGFLFIEGRISRFSKIAGEMVPHGTIEDALHRLYPAVNEDSAVEFAIVSLPDEEKGEALILVTTRELNWDEMRHRLHTEAGLPNLWIPRRVKLVDKIPVLASGKLDLAGLKKLVMEN
ncbi:MAG: MFS transporter [Methylacidiphilales bacterium]|nr:MFS transporter [Candidatus Methylacidiphilales bacterium]MDW8349708.1 MFS transporter [Verrucomicrobiae bacterium]